MDASEQPTEHRWGSRVSVHATASLRRIYGLETPARIRDVSLSGAFVETTDRPLRFSRIAIRAVENSGEWIEAWVVRADTNGVGLEWLEPGSQLVQDLLLSQQRTARRRVASAVRQGARESAAR